MDNKIVVEKKTHYGTEHIYIVSKQADSIRALTGQRTLTPRNIESLKNLGRILYLCMIIYAMNLKKRVTKYLNIE